jgi:hypothetical protein
VRNLILNWQLRSTPAARKEIAGELVSGVGKPASEKAIGFVMGLLTGDAKGATKGITKDDFQE